MCNRTTQYLLQTVQMIVCTIVYYNIWHNSLILQYSVVPVRVCSSQEMSSRETAEMLDAKK